MRLAEPDPREVQLAYVVKGGSLAGTLSRRDGSVVFQYQEEYLGSGGRAVATTLPLTDEPLVTVGGAVRHTSPTSCPQAGA